MRVWLEKAELPVKKITDWRGRGLQPCFTTERSADEHCEENFIQQHYEMFGSLIWLKHLNNNFKVKLSH